MKPSALIAGRTYFRLTFADRDLTMPGVEPIVFLGEVTDDDGTNGFVFQDPSSYVQYGSGLEGEEQHEDIVLYFVPADDLGTVSELAEVAAEVTAAAERAGSLDFPVLRVSSSGKERTGGS